MTKKEKAKYIIDELERLYPETPVPLNHKDPYTLLIAVLLSAQCTDERVNKITPALFELADNPFDMSKQDVEEIRLIIRPCGLSLANPKQFGSYRISWSINTMVLCQKKWNCSKNCQGVGHKTASVVVSQAFGQAAFPVDTHIHRLLTRWGITNGKNVVQTEKDAKKIFPIDTWNKLHLQIIFYGRAYSPARNPKKEIDHITLKIGTKKALNELR